MICMYFVFDAVLHVVRSVLVCQNVFLTLNEIMTVLEYSDEKFSQNFYNIPIAPTQSPKNYVTDEVDSQILSIRKWVLVVLSLKSP